jgi:hypothetical protein
MTAPSRTIVLPNLSDYKNEEPTKNCYLDGRYFNLVFQTYPGLVRTPIRIFIGKSGDKTFKGIEANNIRLSDMVSFNIIRIIIETPHAKHANLLIVDRNAKMGYWFDPRSSPYGKGIKKLLSNTVGLQFGIRIKKVNKDIAPQDSDEPKEGCSISGFCMAYVIKYAYDFLRGTVFDSTDIQRFAAKVESIYGPLPEEGKDVEYDWTNQQATNTLLGGLGGAVIGGAIGGPTGALLGAGAGGLAGYALTPQPNRNYYGNYGQPYGNYGNYGNYGRPYNYY